MSQINQFINRQLASGLPEGSISALNYATLLIGLIGAIASYVIGILVYPKLAKAANTGKQEYWGTMVTTGLKLIWIISVPMQMVFLFYSRTIVQIVFERNAFDAVSAEMTAIAVFYFSFGTSMSMIGGLLVQAFHSKSEMMLPMKIALFTLSVHIGLNFLLVQPLAHGGLALAGSMSNALDGGICLAFLIRNKWIKIDFQYLKGVFKIIISAGIGVASMLMIESFLLLPLLPGILPAGRFFIVFAIAVAIYFLSLKKMRVEELSLLRKIVKRA